MKKGRKDTFWAFPGDVFRYTLNMYRYTLCSGHFWPMCTGTLCVLVIFGQCVPVHIRDVPVHPVLLFQF